MINKVQYLSNLYKYCVSTLNLLVNFLADGSTNRFLNSSLKTNQSDPGKTNFLAEMYFKKNPNKSYGISTPRSILSAYKYPTPGNIYLDLHDQKWHRCPVGLSYQPVGLVI